MQDYTLDLVLSNVTYQSCFSSIRMAILMTTPQSLLCPVCTFQMTRECRARLLKYVRSGKQRLFLNTMHHQCTVVYLCAHPVTFNALSFYQKWEQEKQVE